MDLDFPNLLSLILFLPTAGAVLVFGSDSPGTNAARYFLPHIFALSTNSPFWEGRNTGLKSYRSKIFDRFPRTYDVPTFLGDVRVRAQLAIGAFWPRAEVPDDLWQNNVVLWAGPKTHLVHYPLRRGELYNLVAVFHSDRYEEGWDVYGDPAELRARFASERPEVLRLLAKINVWKMWVLCDREPVRHWSRGRVALLVDELLRDGMQVRCLVRRSSSRPPPGQNTTALLSSRSKPRLAPTRLATIMSRPFFCSFSSAWASSFPRWAS